MLDTNEIWPIVKHSDKIEHLRLLVKNHFHFICEQKIADQTAHVRSLIRIFWLVF